MAEIPYKRAWDLISSRIKDKVGRLGFSEHLVFVTKLQIYRLPVWPQKGKACPGNNFVRLHVSRSPRTRCERRSANLLLILASAEIQCSMECGCCNSESSEPWIICRQSSGDCAGIVECKRKQSFYLSSVVIMALVNSKGFLIWYFGSSLSATSRDENPIPPLRNVIWWFLLISISIGRVSWGWVHMMLTKIRPVDTASLLGWKVDPGGKRDFGSPGEYFQHLALLASTCIV